MEHIPVLLKEVVEFLNPQPNENFIDCTYGFGGHAAAILEKTQPNGKVLGIEVDAEVLQKTQERMAEFSIFNYQFPKERLILMNDSYINLKEIVERENFKNVAGILFDLGMSSWDLEKSGRGFSFQKDELLDMRFFAAAQNDETNGITAEEIINKWSQKELERILKEYGEERWAGKIARKIVDIRCQQPIKTTFQLINVIKQAISGRLQHSRIHFATRTFQALRIAVNKELENLEQTLPQALEILDKGGRIAIISFHSLEDRIVKNFFKENKQKGLIEILTKKPVMAQTDETMINPRSAGAKLRAGIKL